MLLYASTCQYLMGAKSAPMKMKAQQQRAPPHVKIEQEKNVLSKHSQSSIITDTAKNKIIFLF